MRDAVIALILLAAMVPLAGQAQESGAIVEGAIPQDQPNTAPDGATDRSTLVVPSNGAVGQTLIMTIDPERLFLESAWGRRASADTEQSGLELVAENEKLVEQFSREERELTELRDTLPADEFRKRADEFDTRVAEVRRERDAKIRELQQMAQTERTAFRQAFLPILVQLMQERGAVAVLDQRDTFASAEAIDITEDMIQRVDAEAGPGPVARNVPKAADEGEGQGSAGQGPATPASK